MVRYQLLAVALVALYAGHGTQGAETREFIVKSIPESMFPEMIKKTQAYTNHKINLESIVYGNEVYLSGTRSKSYLLYGKAKDKLCYVHLKDWRWGPERTIRCWDVSSDAARNEKVIKTIKHRIEQTAAWLKKLFTSK